MEYVKKKRCPCCNKLFSYTNSDTIQDENSSYGSTKYVYCPECGKANILSIKEDAYDNNNDIRFVTQTKRK